MFDTWRECEKQVKGFAGAQFKSFKSRDDANKYVNNQVARCPVDALVIYTDGSRKSDGGAGWGYVVTKNEDVIKESFGPVVVEKDSKNYIGAQVLTNNTAELSAIYHALCYVKKNTVDEVWIKYDSEYAAKSTLGEFNGAKNAALIKSCRDALHDVQERVRFEHVKGHSGDRFNDHADRLASRGADLSHKRKRGSEDDGVRTKKAKIY